MPPSTVNFVKINIIDRFVGKQSVFVIELQIKTLGNCKSAYKDGAAVKVTPFHNI